jgi:ATP/maltotriose-dependent transcriptional regulator MalT
MRLVLPQEAAAHEMACKLRLSVATAHNHVHSILEKLCVHDRRAAVERARRLGWIKPSRRQVARHTGRRLV